MTVMTLTEAQRNYLRAAIACLLTVQGEAAARDRVGTPAGFCAALRNEVLEIATDGGMDAPLDHQDGSDLMEMLATSTVDLRTRTAPAGITPYYSEEPGGYAGQVPAEDEVWVVPCKLTIAGAETADEAAVMADTILGRAQMDETINADECLLAFEVGNYDPVTLPGEAARDLALGDSYMG